MDLEALVTDELRDERRRATRSSGSTSRPRRAARRTRRSRVRTPDGEERRGLVHRRRPGRRDLPRDQRRDRASTRGCASSASTRSPAARTRSARSRVVLELARASRRPARASRPTSSRPRRMAYVRALSNGVRKARIAAEQPPVTARPAELATP